MHPFPNGEDEEFQRVAHVDAGKVNHEARQHAHQAVVRIDWRSRPVVFPVPHNLLSSVSWTATYEFPGKKVSDGRLCNPLVAHSEPGDQRVDGRIAITVMFGPTAAHPSPYRKIAQP